jgi:hypothetical protein
MFAKFLEYLNLHDTGAIWQDQTYKWYDLLYTANNRRLRRALSECGFRGGELSILLADFTARVRERGYETMSDAMLQQCLLEWYVWHRLNAGVYKKWKYRT